MRRVKIKGLPKKAQGGGTGGTSEGLRRFMEGEKTFDSGMNPFSEPKFEFNKSISGVPREEANIEAEGGETAIVPGMGGIPESYKIVGPRHGGNGVPLNLAPDSFIFSDNKKGMKIKDKEILAEFGMSVPKKGRVKGYTPAEISKKYDLNKFKEILMDPNSDKIERETAELMIENYNLKLGKLALVQESMKGFPQGIPAIATPYMQTVEADPQTFMPQAAQGQPEQPPMAAYGAGVVGDPSQYSYQGGGATSMEVDGQFYPIPTMTNIPDSAHPRNERPGFMMRPGQYGEANWFDSPEPGTGIDSVPGGRNFFESAKISRRVNKDIRDKDLDFKRLKLNAFKSPDTGGSYNFQNGGVYEGAFWKSILQDGGYIPYAQQGQEYDPFNDPNLSDEQYEQLMRKGITPNKSWSSQSPDPNEPMGPMTTYPGYTDMQNPEAKKKSAKKIKGGDGVWYYVFADGTFEQVPTEEVSGVTVNTEPGVVMTGDTKPVVASTRTTPTVSVPTKYKDNAMYNASSSEFDLNNLNEGDYYKNAQGKWRKITYAPDVINYEGADLQTAFGGDSDYANAYAYLETTFRDPTVKKEFANQTRAALRNDDLYVGKSGKKSEMYSQEEVDNMTDDQLVDQFLIHQKRNYSLQANRIDPKDFEDSNGNRLPDDQIDPAVLARYKELGIGSLNEAFNLTGVPITAEEQAAGNLGIQQGTYWGYHNLLQNKDTLDKDLQSKLEFFHEPQEGFSDEPLNKTISPIDSKKNNFYTNTTAGHLALVDQGQIKDEAVAEEEQALDPLKPGKAQFTGPAQDDAPWWIQDRWNVSNLLGQRLGIKKYLPHSFPVDLARPDVLYYDPSRALAANIEQQQIGNEFLRGTANSAQQAYAATKFSGDAFKRGMDTIGQYENMNVAIGNQYLDKVKQTEDQEAMYNAQRMKKLYDEWTIANQQFDNSKRAMNRNLTEGMIQGQTNAMMAQAFNTQSEQFKTDPNIGGGMWWTGQGKPFVDTGYPGNSNESYLSAFSKMKNQYPDIPDNVLKQQIDMNFGQQSNAMMNPQMAQQKAMMQMYAGAFNPAMFQG